MPITDLLERNSKLYGEEIALVEINPEIQEAQRVTWKEYELIQPTSSVPYRRAITWSVFDEKANRVANMLLGRGIRKGQKVAILLMNCLEWLPIYFGIVALFFVPNLFLGRRAMCHGICWMAPFMVLGEKLGAALRLPQLHVGAEADRCIGCGKCDRVCPMSLPVERLLRAGTIEDAECIQCAACADACPKDVLKLRMSRVR